VGTWHLLPAVFYLQELLLPPAQLLPACSCTACSCTAWHHPGHGGSRRAGRRGTCSNPRWLRAT
jgi:hypothetical protein